MQGSDTLHHNPVLHRVLPLTGMLCVLMLLASCGGSSGGATDDPGFINQCVAGDRPQGAADAQLVRAFPNLSFSLALAMLQAPGDATRWFVVEKGGRVRVFDNTGDVSASTAFIDISDRVDAGYGESGLLGMAFHPDFASNRQVFLSYTASGSPLVSRISRFTSNDGGLSLDPASESILLSVNQPYTNHNGGHIAFGSDGLLYIGLGDGGSGGDPAGHAQNTNTLLGALLRIDVDGATPYAIPADNPFAGGGGRGEIYAWGLRNPWRWSFDKTTDTLWLGDVGQNNYEEINRILRGGNYGWNVREAAHCYNAASCDGAGLIDPVAEYDHTLGCSVTGGYVYRGTRHPQLTGVYVYGDFCSGRIWGLLEDPQLGLRPHELLASPSGLNISGFAQGSDGEVYVLEFGGGGGVYRLDPATATALTGPLTLSSTGCTANDPTQPAAGLIAYDINAPFWSDGAQKERWLSLPRNGRIRIESDQDWTLPIGSVLMKHFRLDGQLIETRLFMRHTDGQWGGYSFEWNDKQTEARWVRGGKRKDIGGQVWHYPSTDQCLRCHTTAAGRSLGLETAQLNRDFHDPVSGRDDNLLTLLDEAGHFEGGLAAPPADLPALSAPLDTLAELNLRARAYLHTNCAQCHRPGGPTPSAMDLRFGTAIGATGICDVPPAGGDLGVSNARIVAPTEPGRSVLALRMQRRDAHGMPPLGSALIDTQGIALINAWIAGMDMACQ